MKSLWLEHVIDSVADRGRELLHLGTGGKASANIEKLCRALLSEKGEASGTALAREVVQTYAKMTDEDRVDFFDLLNFAFGPDEDAIIAAADEFKASRRVDDYLALAKAVEPARQKLFRRINIAPNGIEALVGMRADLQDRLKQHPRFKPIDVDLKHLLSSWFNRGFLEMRRIDWKTSAAILEKLINYESVHEIRSWADLQRRLAMDRRCFAFFHPALPEEPLIFVEAALVNGMSETIDPLLEIDTPVLDPGEADSVIFYSINNCLRGLRGISFGNFLIKQVATELAREFPGLKLVSTLSPMPRFRRALQDERIFTSERLSAILKEDAQDLTAAAGNDDLRPALDTLLTNPLRYRDALERPLRHLGLAYLTLAKWNNRPYDPVANFHLSNGARLERINAFANTSPNGIGESAGLMVNYRYAPEEFESNHEAFVHRQQIPLSKKLSKQYRQLKEIW